MADPAYQNPYVDPYPGASANAIDMRRRYALGVLQQAGDGTPTKANAIGAIARALQGAMGGYLAGQADQSDLADKAATQSLVQKLIGGDTSGTPAPASGAPVASASTPPATETPFSTRFGNWQQGPGGASSPAPQQQPQYASAISGIESGGNYALLGPVINRGAYAGDRAYGKYQVMGKNVPEWTQEVLGKPMAPQEFLSNPQAQDAVFNAKFGQYAQRYGPEGAARAWFAGEGGMNDPTRKDQLGTTVSSYAKQFNAGMGGQQPYQVASLNPTAPPDSAPQATPAAPVAPPQQVAQNAPQAAPGAGNSNRAALIAQLLATRSGGAIGTALAGKLMEQQIAQPELKLTKNILGEDVPNTWDPTHQLWNGQPLQPGVAPGGAAAAGTPDELMSAAEKKYPGVTNRVEQLYRGEGGMPNKRTNPLDGAAMQLIQQVHPDWNMTVWKQKSDTAADYSTKGKSGQSMENLAKIANHMGDLMDSMKEQGNGQYPLKNYITNSIGTALGSEKTNNVNINITAVADEMASLMRREGMSDESIRQWKENISPNASEEQQKGALRKMSSLIMERMEPLASNYERVMGKPIDLWKAFPGSQRNYNRIQAWANSKPGTPEAAQAPTGPLKSGTYNWTPNGLVPQ